MERDGSASNGKKVKTQPNYYKLALINNASKYRVSLEDEGVLPIDDLEDTPPMPATLSAEDEKELTADLEKMVARLLSKK